MSRDEPVPLTDRQLLADAHRQARKQTPSNGDDETVKRLRRERETRTLDR